MARAFGEGEDQEKKGGDKIPKKPGESKEGEAENDICCSNSNDENDSLPSPSTSAASAENGNVIEEAVEGQHLYLDFIREEMSRNGLDQELNCFDSSAQRVISGDMVDPARLMDWTRAGRELRQIADSFSQSRERQVVRQRAKNVTLEALDFDNFFQLLQELFQGNGITRERILVLFFFCADVAIEALKRGFHKTFHNLLGWSLRYIATIVAQYVHSVGGWGVVLRQSLDIAYQVSACCAFLAIVAACAVYIRRNLN